MQISCADQRLELLRRVQPGNQSRWDQERFQLRRLARWHGSRVPPPTYGSFTEPTIPGSGGGNGYGGAAKPAGGAAIHVIVEDTLTVLGAIDMAGSNPDTVSGNYWTNHRGPGGSSGGSVWIEVGKFAGTGTVTVNGGAGGHVTSDTQGYGAGGGRLSISYDSWTHTGTLSAYGGYGTGGYGQPGTIFLKSLLDPSETVLILDTGKDRTSFGTFPFYDPDDPFNLLYTFENLYLDGNIDVKFAPDLGTSGVGQRTMLTLQSLQGSEKSCITVKNTQTLKLLGER